MLGFLMGVGQAIRNWWRGLNKFAWLVIAPTALALAGCAAYFSVRGIALLFGTETEFMYPVIIMAASLEIGKLVLASFAYRVRATAKKVHLCCMICAVLLLMGVTSIGIYGYLSQAFENTISMVEGLEEEIVSLEKEQLQYDRQVVAHQASSRQNIVLVERRNEQERIRLQAFIDSRRVDINEAESRKGSLSEETDRVIAADRTGRELARKETSQRIASEKVRLEGFIVQRRADIAAQETRKASLAKETDRLIETERSGRELVRKEKSERITVEKTRLEAFIKQRRDDVSEAESMKTAAKEEADRTTEAEQARIQKVNERLATLEASVKIYRDKGPGGFLKEDGIKKANELLKAQAPEREALRKEVADANDNIRNARGTLDSRRAVLSDRIREIDTDIAEANRKITELTSAPAPVGTGDMKVALDNLQAARASIDERIQGIEKEIAEASLKITELTATSPVLDASNVKVALENLQSARSSIDERIQGIEKDIAGANLKITELSEQERDSGPDGSDKSRIAIAGIRVEKERARQDIIEKRRRIREIDLGSLKFVAKALDPSGQQAELGESSLAWRQSMQDMVKWFILVLVLIFDPLAVGLVLAFNVALLGGLTPPPARDDDDDPPPPLVSKRTMLAGGVALILLILLWNAPWQTPTDQSPSADQQALAAPVASVDNVAPLADYLPDSAFAVCSFDDPRLLEAVGSQEDILHFIIERAPFIKEVCSEPEDFGIDGDSRCHYFFKFPFSDWRTGVEDEVIVALALPLVDEGKLREELLYRLDLKGDGKWLMEENSKASYASLRHKNEHLLLGFDQNCLLVMTSVSASESAPEVDADFLAKELNGVFAKSGSSWSSDNEFVEAQKRQFDLAFWFDSGCFFEDLSKDAREEELYLSLQPFIDFRCSLEGQVSVLGKVSVDARYFYESPVLNEKFGTRVASAFHEVESDVPGVAEDTLGMKIFSQKLDFNTVCRKLGRLNLNNPNDSIESKKFASNVIDEKAGQFMLSFKTSEMGGVALTKCIQLLVDVLDPLEAIPRVASAGGE